MSVIVKRKSLYDKPLLVCTRSAVRSYAASEWRQGEWTLIGEYEGVKQYLEGGSEIELYMDDLVSYYFDLRAR